MDPKKLEVKTYTYKTVKGLAIKADVRRPKDTCLRRPRPSGRRGRFLFALSTAWHPRTRDLRLGSEI